jgi:hypothetical protein
MNPKFGQLGKSPFTFRARPFINQSIQYRHWHLEQTLTTSPQPAKSVTDAAGDLFLSGSYIELGVSSWGNFGTTQGQTPDGYAQAGSQGVGLTYNQAGFGVNEDIPTIDYFTPGTPYESFAAGYTIGALSSFGSNYKDGSVQGITTTSLTDESSGLKLSAEWIGVLNSKLRVTIGILPPR